jgi:hypothetical protein
MEEDKLNGTEEQMMQDPLVPGTYQIRKITSRLNPMELLATAEHLAAGGYDKKLFGVLSRVFTEHKGFHFEKQEGMEELLQSIMASDVPTELKMQTFTSFEIPVELAPDAETAMEWLKNCAPKRLNIAAYFMAAYGYGKQCYPQILENRSFFRAYIQAVSPEELLRTFEAVLENEKKEYITGFIRSIKNSRRRFNYTDTEYAGKVTEKVFASREAFYTSKILYCLAFSIPRGCLPPDRELYKILRICVNYEEKCTEEFVKRYRLDFDMSEAAVCRYLLANKKTDKERALVAKFAAHVVLVDDAEQKRKLLHAAFKRGGMFRMYAGCMQDGRVDEQKQKRFHYTDEQIGWVKTLPGLN